MSNIPRARAILEQALQSTDAKFVSYCIRMALKDMSREAPDFVSKAKLPPLTQEQVDEVRKLRASGMPLNEIARKFGTNIGRVSEVIHGKRDGI